MWTVTLQGISRNDKYFNMQIHKFCSILNLNIYCTSWPYTILLANATAQNGFFKTTYILSYTLECSLHNSTKSMLYMACFGAVTICSVNTPWINRAPCTITRWSLTAPWKIIPFTITISWCLGFCHNFSVTFLCWWAQIYNCWGSGFFF